MKPKHRNLLLILTSVILIDLGQLILKFALNQYENIIWNAATLISNFFYFAFDPLIWIGVFLMIFSALTWLMALSKTSLSYAYPILSIGYVLVAVLSWLCFDEIMNITKAIGLDIIAIGVFMLSNT